MNFNYWLPVLAVAFGTFIYRYSFIGGKLKFQMPELIRRSLEYVPIAVMGALVASGFLLDQDKFFVLHPPSLIAAAAAIFMALKFRRDLLTILVGLGIYWLTESLM